MQTPCNTLLPNVIDWDLGISVEMAVFDAFRERIVLHGVADEYSRPTEHVIHYGISKL